MKYRIQYLVPRYGANFARALIYKTTISGNTATVVASFNSNYIRGEGNQIPPNTMVKFSTLDMVKKNGKWLISQCQMEDW
jgi:hypothetical protein